MEKLSFDFYKSLYEDLENYEDILQQLVRDYERELRESFIIAIDFSELHDYIHSTSIDAKRASINKYILNNLNDSFTILPGSCYELLKDLLKDLKDISGMKKNGIGMSNLIRNFETVKVFLDEFPLAIQDYDKAIDLYRNRYGNAEKEIEMAISFLLTKLVPRFASIQSLQDLINNKKIVPITGIEQIQSLEKTSRDRYQSIYNLIESALFLRRIEKPMNNRIDAIDSIITMLLNEESSTRYITIYSQTTQLIHVLKSYEELKCEKDYIVRDAQYLKFRTNLQKMFDSIEQRLLFAKEWIEKCQTLKSEISKLVDIDKRLHEEKGVVPSVKLIDLYRQFDEECKQQIDYIENSDKQDSVKVYKKLCEQGIYEGKVEESLEVLKEHFKNIFKQMDMFDSFITNSEDLSSFRNNIKKWLGL